MKSHDTNNQGLKTRILPVGLKGWWVDHSVIGNKIMLITTCGLPWQRNSSAMRIIVTTTGLNVSKQDLPTNWKTWTNWCRRRGSPSFLMFDQTFLMLYYDALKSACTPPKDTMIDLLWHSAYFFKKCWPGWSGFMSNVSVGQQDGKADFTMLLKLIWIIIIILVSILHLCSL